MVNLPLCEIPALSDYLPDPTKDLLVVLVHFVINLLFSPSSLPDLSNKPDKIHDTGKMKIKQELQQQLTKCISVASTDMGTTGEIYGNSIITELNNSF